MQLHFSGPKFSGEYKKNMKEYKIFTFYEKCIEKIDHWRQISDKKGYVKKMYAFNLAKIKNS